MDIDHERLQWLGARSFVQRTLPSLLSSPECRKASRTETLQMWYNHIGWLQRHWKRKEHQALQNLAKFIPHSYPNVSPKQGRIVSEDEVLAELVDRWAGERSCAMSLRNFWRRHQSP